MTNELHIIPVKGIGEISLGDDLAGIISDALQEQKLQLEEKDILIVTQKIVSKAEGRIVNLNEIKPSLFAQEIAKSGNKDAQYIEVVLQQTKRIIRMDHGVLICETHHGFICANAGVDE